MMTMPFHDRVFKNGRGQSNKTCKILYPSGDEGACIGLGSSGGAGVVEGMRGATNDYCRQRGADRGGQAEGKTPGMQRCIEVEGKEAERT